MKKIIKPFVLVAAAAMALASCQKNEISAPEKQDVHFTINAGIETKTSIVESADKDENGKPIYHAQWDGDEELGLLFAAPTDKTEAKDVVTLANTISGRTATFQGNVTVDPTSGTFYAFYPASAFACGYADGDARLDLKNTQKPTATSFDPTCDILVAKPYNYEVVDGKVVADGLEFARLMSVLRIDLKSEFADIQNEFVESVSFTAGDVKITGYARIFLDNPKFDKWESNGTQWCTVTANYDSELVSINGASNSVYLVIAPVTIPANKDLTFEIKTKNYNISKTIKSPEMKFTAGKVSKINLTIAEANCEKVDMTVDYSGEYLIVGKEGEKWYAAKKYTSGNYLAVSEIEFVGENIIETETISDHYMTIEKVVGGDYDGMYTIVDAGGKYLSTSSSSSNDMKAVESASKDTYWTIVKDDAKGSYSIVASKSQYSRNDMRFNYNNGTNSRVSCYDGLKTNLPYFTLFSTSLVKPDTTPKLVIALEDLELTFEAADGEIAVTAKNLPSDLQVRALTAMGSQDEVDWLTVTYADGKITYTATANESEDARTAYIEAYVSDDLKDGVAVTQAGKPAAGAPVEVTDVLTRATTGVSNGGGYSNWSGKTAQSSAVYAGQSAGANDAIQLRTTNSNSGIVTTTSGGHVKKIVVTWQSATQSGRILDVYGKNTAYTAATDLYDTSKQGTKLGSIKCGTSTELVITGDYQYIGLRSNGSAMYLTEIAITWSSESGSGSGETPEPEPEQLEMSAITCSAQTENSLTFTWTAVANATGYEVTCNNKTETVTTTQYVAANLAASTSYTISVVAKGNGTDYLDSEPKTQTGTTKEEQGGDAAETSYVKVTATPSDWSGTYLIVYESGTTAYVYNGTDSEAKNYVSATISDNQIARSSAVDAVAVQIAKSGSGYSIKVPNGKYISGGTSNGTTFNTSAVANTITLNTNGTVKINNNTTTSFQFNSASDQMRFRYFKSAQKSVYLYKLN